MSSRLALWGTSRYVLGRESTCGHAVFLLPRVNLRFNFLKSLHDKSATCLVVGAGFIGVEWATEIQHFFPRAPGTAGANASSGLSKGRPRVERSGRRLLNHDSHGGGTWWQDSMFPLETGGSYFDGMCVDVMLGPCNVAAAPKRMRPAHDGAKLICELAQVLIEMKKWFPFQCKTRS